MPFATIPSASSSSATIRTSFAISPFALPVSSPVSRAALAAINFEIANSAYLGAIQSGLVLFATYIGGVALFHRPDPRRDLGDLSVSSG